MPSSSWAWPWTWPSCWAPPPRGRTGPGAAAPVRAAGGGDRAGAVRALLPGQSAALAAERAAGGGVVARIVSAELSGPLETGALRRALAALSARHEGLRTAFAATPRGPVRRVLAVCPPPLVTLEPVTAAPGEDLVAAAHARLAARAGRLVGQPGLPPLAFVLTPLAAGSHLLSFVHHDAVADSRSAALLWQELLADYDRAVSRRPLDRTPAPARTGRPGRAGPGAGAATKRAERLRSLAAGLDLAPAARPAAAFDFRGERLLFGLGTRLRDAADATARRAGVPHSTVLLAAWALAVGGARAANGCWWAPRCRASPPRSCCAPPCRARRRCRWPVNWMAASTTSCAVSPARSVRPSSTRTPTTPMRRAPWGRPRTASAPPRRR
ncbi:condensation domain-containing protein [Streptomyces kaempferi]